MKRVASTALFGLVAALLPLSYGPPAFAAAPANDEWRSATRMTLPYHVVEETAGATLDSQPPPLHGCGDGLRSVWFRIALGKTHPGMVISTAGSNYDTILDLYRRNGPGDWSHLDCNDDGNYDATSRLNAELEAGKNYFVRVTAFAVDSQTGSRLELAVHHRLRASAHLAHRARLDPVDGSVTVHGTLRCSLNRSAVRLSVSLRQRSGGVFVAEGTAQGSRACGPSERVWRLSVNPRAIIAFHRGTARVSASSWFACEPKFCYPTTHHFVRRSVEAR